MCTNCGGYEMILSHKPHEFQFLVQR